MKKLTTLALAAGLIVAAAAPASAVDTKVDGNYVFTFQRDQTGFQGADNEFIKQRLRLGLTLTASENLSGYVQFETKEGWKSNATMDNVETRFAYIDWVIPGTSAKVRMGRFEHGIPAESFAGNTVWGPGAVRTGVQVSSPVTDWMSMTALWSRTGFGEAEADNQKHVNAASSDVSAGDNADIFGVFANMKFDGLNVTPWAAAAFTQNGAKGEHRGPDINNGLTSQAYWGGVLGTLSMFDPLTVKASAAIGTRDYSGGYDRTGWYAQVNASYKLAFGTPSFGFWYGSGDDADVKYAQQNWCPTTGAGKFAPSHTYFDNAYGLAGGTSYGNIQGTWGLKLGLTGVSFLNGLTHDFAVVMINGTNHDTAAAMATAPYYLTWSDTVYEFDFGTTYQIYKNLAANLELAYLINDLDDQSTKSEDDWRVALSFKYAF